MAFVGINPGTKHTYIVTGDSGNGLTHGVLAGRLIADQIEGVSNDWGKAVRTVPESQPAEVDGQHIGARCAGSGTVTDSYSQSSRILRTLRLGRVGY